MNWIYAVLKVVEEKKSLLMGLSFLFSINVCVVSTLTLMAEQASLCKFFGALCGGSFAILTMAVMAMLLKRPFQSMTKKIKERLERKQ